MIEMIHTDEREESHGLAAAVAIGGVALAFGAVALLTQSRPAGATEDADVLSPELAAMAAADERRLTKLPDPAARTRQRSALLLANSLDVLSVSKLLGEPVSRTAERLNTRVLYAFRSRDGWRIPAFQFSGGRIVRHLHRVVPRLGKNLLPLEVMNWFNGDNPDLQLDGEQVSPLTWLAAGGDPTPVIKLAECVGRPS